MSTGKLLSVEPQELEFPFELKKQISCAMQLTNKTDHHVGFKMKNTNPEKYCVQPYSAVVSPHSTFTMQAQKEAPSDMQCTDTFLLQSAIAVGFNRRWWNLKKDYELFNKESGNQVEVCKLKVNYVSPPQPPSPVRERSKEGSSPRGSVSDNGTINTIDSTAVPKAYPESHEKSSETRDLISKLTDEMNSVIQQLNKLHQELELLKRQVNKTHGDVPFLSVLLIGFFCFLLGVFAKVNIPEKPVLIVR